MSGSPAATDCLFCLVADSPQEALEWHDCPLARVPGVGGVIAGLGAFVPGYVLVYPQQHVESTKLIPIDRLSSFRTMLHKVVRTVASLYGPVTIFEHGSCPHPDQRRSACLSHAHVHVIPGSYGLSSYMSASTDGCELAHAGYLFLEEPSASPQFSLDPGISQFFRRCIAQHLGIADQWDYLMFPQLDNVLMTIDRLRGRLV